MNWDLIEFRLSPAEAFAVHRRFEVYVNGLLCCLGIIKSLRFSFPSRALERHFYIPSYLTPKCPELQRSVFPSSPSVAVALTLYSLASSNTIYDLYEKYRTALYLLQYGARSRSYPASRVQNS